MIFIPYPSESTVRTKRRANRLMNPYHPRLLFLSPQRWRQIKIGGIDRHIGLHLPHGNGLRIRMVLWSLRDREGIHHSVYGLVRTELHHAIALRAADKLLDLPANLDEGIGIEIVVNNVTIFQRDLQSQSVVAIDDVVPKIFDVVAFLFVIDQRTVEVGVEQQVAQIVFAHQLRSFLSSEGLNVPTG